jgi:CMP/dCMP kinase
MVARLLGARYMDRDLMAQAAERVGVTEAHVAERDERVQGQTERLMETLRLAFTGLRRPATPITGEGLTLTDAELVEATRQAIEDMAATGNAVIVGRGAQAVLRDVPDVLHIHIVAPLEKRLERVAQYCHLDENAARQRIAKVDGDRANYLRKYYLLDWEDPTLYHLTINTGCLDQTEAAEVIVLAALRQSNGKGGDESTGTLPAETRQRLRSLLRELEAATLQADPRREGA